MRQLANAKNLGSFRRGLAGEGAKMAGRTTRVSRNPYLSFAQGGRIVLGEDRIQPRIRDLGG